MAKKERTWAKEHPAEARAAVNLRIQGVSEKAIYQNYRKLLRGPPSYRDLRAFYREKKVLLHADATAMRHGNQRLNSKGRFVLWNQANVAEMRKRAAEGGMNPRGESSFQVRRSTQFQKAGKVKLERDYAVGYLLGEGLESDVFVDEGVVEFLDSEFEVGSP